MESENQLSQDIALNVTDISLSGGLVLIVICLVASTLISIFETAFASLKPEEIKKLVPGNSKRSFAIAALLSNPRKSGYVLLVSNTLISITFILLSSIVSLRLFNPADGEVTGFIISITILLLMLLVSIEIIPKVINFSGRRIIIGSLAYPVLFLSWLLYPVTSVIGHLTSAAKKRQSLNNESPDLGANGNSEKMNDDEKILKGIENFGNTSVSAIMCPRIDVIAIDIKWTFDRIIPVIISSGFSRIPVYSGSFDTVKGILYAKDVLPYAANPSSFKWQSLLRPSYFVPETKKINDLLREFQLRKIHMAIVIDEYGGASGIITLEDILEEIVGDITDENDEDEILYRKTGDSDYIFEGKILLHDFCRILDVSEDLFEDIRGESETLAGLLLEIAGEIPQKDQIINFDKFIFRIESVDRRRIREVHVTIKKEE